MFLGDETSLILPSEILLGEGARLVLWFVVFILVFKLKNGGLTPILSV